LKFSFLIFVWLSVIIIMSSPPTASLIVYRKAATIPDRDVLSSIDEEEEKEAVWNCDTCRAGIEQGFGAPGTPLHRHGICITPGTVDGAKLEWLCHLLECPAGLQNACYTVTMDGTFEFPTSTDILHFGNALQHAKRLGDLRGTFRTANTMHLAYVRSVVEARYQEVDDEYGPMSIDDFQALVAVPRLFAASAANDLLERLRELAATQPHYEEVEMEEAEDE
jgi:hypothetical protein